MPENYLKNQKDLEEFIGNELLFKRLMNEEEIFLKISPFLFFKILVNRAHRELKWETFTVEKHGIHKVYVFDTNLLSDILEKKEIRDYLALLLASFSRMRSFNIYVLIAKKLYKFKQTSLDVETLEEELNYLEEKKRFPLLRRIADTILFLCGIFPEYVKKRAEMQARTKRKGVPEVIKEFEEKGSVYYLLASMHEDAKSIGLSEVLYTLGQNFSLLKKPLNFIEKKYLSFKKDRIF